MITKSLAIAAALSLAACSAFAASGGGPANNPVNAATNAQPAAPQTSTEFSQTSGRSGGSIYRPDVPAYPGEPAHVIGGQTFYFSNDEVPPL
jgi:hypothetical protein